MGFSVPPCLLTVCNGSRPQVDAIRETASNWEQLQKFSDLGLKWKVCWHSGQPMLVDQGVWGVGGLLRRGSTARRHLRGGGGLRGAERGLSERVCGNTPIEGLGLVGGCGMFLLRDWDWSVDWHIHIEGLGLVGGLAY